jgi:two-component system, cell cycle response regulator PopA
MARPQILVLANEDAFLAISQAGFLVAGEDEVRRQTAAVVIEARGTAGLKASDLAKSVRSALGPRAGLFFAWTDGNNADDLSGFDGMLDANAPIATLAARLGSSLRIAVMADEARLRFRSLVRFGGAASPPSIKTDRVARILLFGPPGPAMMGFAAALEAEGARTIASFTSFTAFDYLHEGEFDAVVVVAHDDRAGALGFCAALRRNARLFHLPCLILGSPDFAEPEEAVGRGATDFAFAGDNDAATASRLLDFVEEKRSRDALALAFAAARAPAAMDQATGLYGREFFAAHLAALAERARETDRPLSVALARVERATIDVEPHALNRIVGQVGAMIARLVRAEDVAARLDQTTFGVAFPSSDEDAARIAAERIAAVLECTGFDAGTASDQALQIKIQVSSAELILGQPGHDDAGDLVRRVFARLPASER